MHFILNRPEFQPYFVDLNLCWHIVDKIEYQKKGFL